MLALSEQAMENCLKIKTWI